MTPIRKRLERSRRRLNGLNVLNVTALVLFALLTLSPLPFTRSDAAHAAATGCGFPNSLDTFTDVVTGQTLTASLFNKLQCGVEKLEIAVNGTAGTVVLSSGALTLAAPFIDGSQFYAPDNGSTDAYVATRNKPALAYVTGMWVDLRVNTVNTGAATLNLDNLGVKTITQHDGTTLTDGMLAAGRIYRLQLHADGTFRMAGGQGGGGGTLTGSGTSGKLAKWTGASSLGDSGFADDGSGNFCMGDCSGNRHNVSGVSPTASRTHLFPDASGTMTYRKTLTFSIGDKVTGSALTDGHDYSFVWENDIAAMTIVRAKCQSDAGTPIVNLQRDDGSAANILSSNLTVTTSGATGTIDTGEDNLAIGDKIGFVMVTAGGTVKQIDCTLTMTLD